MWEQLAMMAAQAAMSEAGRQPAPAGGGRGAMNPRRYSVAGADGPDFYSKLAGMQDNSPMPGMKHLERPDLAARVSNKFGDFTDRTGDFMKDKGGDIAMSTLMSMNQPAQLAAPGRGYRRRY